MEVMQRTIRTQQNSASPYWARRCRELKLPQRSARHLTRHADDVIQRITVAIKIEH
jgi:hypothetical protein